LDDDVAGLGHDAKPKTTTQFSAKAHAPNHQKITRALAYNACINGGFCAAKRRKSRPVEAHRAGTNLMHWLYLLQVVHVSTASTATDADKWGDSRLNRYICP
tara:strand:+ start:243 stop:548 length:306 start_codon:yes stop_codon:yes gene_type:complete